MHNSFIWQSGMLILLLAQPSVLLGQSVRPMPPSQPKAPEVPRTLDPREQRARREKAVAVVGATGRDFVEIYGEDAVAAIFACSQEGAQQLVEFHRSGGLGNLPRPGDLLRAIGKPKHGDEVASWALGHAGELMVADCFDAYVLEPLSYALALKKLEDGAAEVREYRRRADDYQAKAAERALRSSNDWRMFALGGGVVGVVLLLVWQHRQGRV